MDDSCKRVRLDVLLTRQECEYVSPSDLPRFMLELPKTVGEYEVTWTIPVTFRP